MFLNYTLGVFVIFILFHFQFKIRYDMQPDYKEKYGSCHKKQSLLHWKDATLYLVLVIY